MEKYWNRLKYGYKNSDDGVHPTGDQLWDLTHKYLHTGILEVAQQNYKENYPEIQLFIDIILQAGKDLHHKDDEIRTNAERYIDSNMFEGDCALLGLEDEIVRTLLLKSVSNKDNILATLDGEADA